MSMYNMIYGVNQAAFYILPMLEDKHPELYPRFRDCFVGRMKRSESEKDEYGLPIRDMVDEDKKIMDVYLRIGGDNRIDYQEEITLMRNNINYIEDYDDSYDETFANFIFSIPEEFIADFDLINENKIKETSQKYRDRLYSVYPKLKDMFDEMFKE